jgi:hypothetical protein
MAGAELNTQNPRTPFSGSGRERGVDPFPPFSIPAGETVSQTINARGVFVYITRCAGGYPYSAKISFAGDANDDLFTFYNHIKYIKDEHGKPEDSMHGQIIDSVHIHNPHDSAIEVSMVALHRDSDFKMSLLQYRDRYVRDRAGDCVSDVLTTRDAGFVTGSDGEYQATLTGGAADQPFTAYTGTYGIKYIEIQAAVANTGIVYVGHAVSMYHELSPGEWYLREMTNPINLHLNGVQGDIVNLRPVGYVNDEEYSCPAQNILALIDNPT